MVHTRLPLIFLASCLAVLFSAGAQDWQDRHTLSGEAGNLTLPVAWDVEHGIHLDLRPEAGGEHISVVLHPQQVGVWRTDGFAPLPEKQANWLGSLFKRGYPVPDGERISEGRYFPSRLPPGNLPRTELVIKLRPSYWQIYLHNRPVALVPRLSTDSLIVAQPIRELPQADPQAIRFQKIRDYTFAADFMVPAEQADQLGTWQSRSGSWQIHSALQDAIEQHTSSRLEKRPLEAERSANFYCLTGSGEQALITNGYAFLDNYEFAASVLLRPGTSGMVFYHEDERNYYELALQVKSLRDATIVATLTRFSSSRLPRRAVLAAVEIDVTADQWVQPRVVAANGRITCYLDDTQIIDLAEDLPVGGRFGLRASSDSDIRFDDVAVRSVNDLRLHNLGWIRFHALHDEGGFLGANDSWLGLPEPDRRDSSRLVQPPHTPSEKWLAIGSPDHGQRVFQATFSSLTPVASYGILAAFRGIDQPHLRFVREITAENERYRLLRLVGDRQDVLLERQRPLTNPEHRLVTLMADATSAGELRLYADDELVLVHHPETRIEGANGLYVGPDSTVRIGGLESHHQRRQLYHNQREKNQIYITDPFMRHWSSPEGQWAQDGSLMWHKSDFFGRFSLHMPYVALSAVHVGVPQGSTRGSLRVAVVGQKLQVQRWDASAGSPTVVSASSEAATATAAPLTPTGRWITLQEAPLPDGISSIKEKAAYTIHYEGTLLWVTDSDNQPLLTRYLKRPLEGHRVRLEGFSFDDLMYSYVEIYNQKDFLFSEAPHAWTVNGGQWQVINRFQCDPRWSHFNGQNGDGLAALWSKYRFSGDFSMELYAGVRHDSRWYNRVGDMNITILNDTTSPGSGYTLATATWDQNESQLWTHLYRNGEILASTDQVLLPRRRSGNRESLDNPLVAAGRQVHGAWYPIKLRRSGTTLEFYYDDKLVMQTEDEAPLASGSAGIWTFMNSMMVARVRISAEHIEPLPHSVRPVSPARLEPSAEPLPDLTISELLRVGEQPLVPIQPAAWTSEDRVAHGQMGWHLLPRGEPAMTFTNTLGGGAMPLRYTGDPVPLQDLAGWRFDVKRTPDAQLNFYYTIGRFEAEEGGGRAFQPHLRFYHQLSGPDFAIGPVQRSGASDVPGQPLGELDSWLRQPGWTTVTAWLPGSEIADQLGEEGWYVQIEGFGIFQESELLKGLTGNYPSATYAIRQFTPITYQAPSLSLAEETAESQAFRTFMLLDPRTHEVLARGDSLKDLQKWFARQDYPALHRVRLRAVGTGQQDLEQNLAWITLPEQPRLAVIWADSVPNAIKLQALDTFRDPRFAMASVTINDQSVEMREPSRSATDQTSSADLGIRVGLVPRQPELYNAEAITVTVQADSYSATKQLPWHTAATDAGVSYGERLDGPPSLLSLGGYDAMLLNFEDRQLPSGLGGSTAVRGLRLAPERLDSYLHTRNNAINQRLKTVFSSEANIATHPLLQFRYRAGEQAHLSLRFGRDYLAALNEPTRRYRDNGDPLLHGDTVRLGQPLHTDDTWYTWTGILSDVPFNHHLRPHLFAYNSLVFGSWLGIDQTGRYSYLDLDDLVLGPAVRQGSDLTITPRYLDPDGVAAVYVALRSGATPYGQLYPEARQLLNWHQIDNQDTFTPDLAPLTEGICHLYIKAVDNLGNSSAITDIPFLYDRQPPITSHALRDWDLAVSNGKVLHLRFDSDGKSPLDIRQLRFLIDDKPVDVDTQLARLIHTAERDTFLIDYPHAFADRFTNMADGDSFELRVSDIVDGAGNRADDMTLTIAVDYASDQRGPAWLPLDLPDNLSTALYWEGHESPRLRVEPGRGNTTTIVHPENGMPHLRTLSYSKRGIITIETKKWNPKQHPMLSVRLRRPTIPKDSESTTQLILNYGEKDRLLVPIDFRRRNRAAINLDDPVDWEAGEWATITLNVYDKLEKAVGRRKASDILITSVDLFRKDTVDNEPIDMYGFTIYRPWEADHSITLGAYDASGLAGLQWSYLDYDRDAEPEADAEGKDVSPPRVIASGYSDSFTLTPAELDLERVPNGWLRLQSKDKAGNLSVPLLLPMPAAE